MIRKTHFINKYDYGKDVVDLDEYVVSLGTNCSLGCEYCYLKFSKTPQQPVIYENFEKFTEEIKELFNATKKDIFYFNLGETTDSFLTKQHFETLEKLIEIINTTAKEHKKFCFVELRTKTANIKKFAKRLFFENVKLIYAATFSPQQLIEKFEKGTANLKERLNSLSFAQQLNFLVGIRLEPIILYPVLGISYKDILESTENLVNEYKSLIKLTLNEINHKNLHSIALSTLRLTKKQFKLLTKQKSQLCFFETFLCPDGKIRYSRPIRINIYKQLIDFIKNLYPELVEKTLLSFEFEYIWRNCNLKIKTLPQLSSNYL